MQSRSLSLSLSALVGIGSLRAYVDYAKDECGVGAQHAQALDITAHTAGCSQAVALPVLALVALTVAARCIFCQQKGRRLYSGTEDAPELEEIIRTDGSGGRQIDSVRVVSGRLVDANCPQRKQPQREGQAHGRSEPKVQGQKRPSKVTGRRSQKNAELEPVLSGER
eukprot:CAMPEP_0119354974 /NCGR_PEP_ID=MMETSP1334-20130426/3922_1 /TAXON_ID=127549 /ORGANISM="Calcidiscus leptoporus, Strain RCC1130" /LENGTH=166 /DNA_ID=CAMNT_0007368691 /DNA_START=77 /DNA_END=577 /DNA_ORIENTATION=-